MQIYNTSKLPAHWVVKDRDDKWWMVPVHAEGWDARTPYIGNFNLEQITGDRVAIIKDLCGIPQKVKVS